MKLQNDNNTDELVYFLGDNGDGTGGYWKAENEPEPIELTEPFADIPSTATQPITNTVPETTNTKPTLLDWFKAIAENVVDYKRAENGLPSNNDASYNSAVPGNSQAQPTTSYKWAVIVLVIVLIAMLAYLVFKKN